LTFKRVFQLVLLKHIEGNVPPGDSRYVADRIKSLGGEISYIDVGEALWFGRYFGGTGTCHSKIGTLATDVAANFKAYQTVFFPMFLLARLRWHWRRPRSTSWRVDETYVEGHGERAYLYRALYKH
jgi:hypothetical protein